MLEMFSSLVIWFTYCILTSSGVKQTERLILNSDFEDGIMSPWFDSSPSNVKWTIEDYSTPFNPLDLPVPEPLNGTKYLRVVRNAQLDPGLAVLLTETKVMAYPGDHISFSFWIRSRRTQANNLEV
jgi:hypothetical protein